MTGPIDTVPVRDAVAGMAGFKFMRNAGGTNAASATDRRFAQRIRVCRYLSRLYPLGSGDLDCKAMSSTARALLWINASLFGNLTLDSKSQ